MGYWDLLDLLYIAEMYRRDDKPSPVASSSLSVNVLLVSLHGEEQN